MIYAASFAAFKNHSQIKKMVAQLVDENGNRRSREEFKKKALEIDSTYNKRYLDVEYDTAVRHARSATQWQQAQATRHLFPNIRYMASVSATKREEHIQYYGLVRPIDDPIWNTILPPNGWECKCWWQQTDEKTNDIPDNLPPPTKGFDFNPGKTGQIFKLSGSEYEKAVKSGKTKDELLAMAKKSVDFDMAANLPYINVYDSKSGTDVLMHPLATHTSDFQTNLTHARELANNPVFKIHKIEILPELNAQNGTAPPAILNARKRLMQAVPGYSNPDYRIDGKYFDLKELKKEDFNPNKTIAAKLGEARRQAGNCVFITPDWVDTQILYRQINGRFCDKSYENFHLYLKHNSEWHYFDKKTWANFHNDYKSKNPQ